MNGTPQPFMHPEQGPATGMGGLMAPPALMQAPPPTPPLPPAPPREEVKPANLVHMPGFPHKRVRTRWDARIRYCRSSYRQNAEDFREALFWLHGVDQSNLGGHASTDAQFSSQVFFSDFNKLVSFYNNRNPRTICAPSKGQESRVLADATAKLSDRCAFETGERLQDSLVVAEGICRNRGYVYNGWDPFRWFPTFRHIRGEVWPDPDCEGDLKTARYIVIESETPIADLLSDETIPEKIRSELRENKGCRRKSRVVREGVTTQQDIDKDYAANQDWDAEPVLDKVVCYKIFTRDGVLPGEATVDEKQAEDGADVRADDEAHGLGAGDAFDRIKPISSLPGHKERNSPHRVLRAPPDVYDDAGPEAREFDPMDAGRRAYILLVGGFDKVLKVTDWPLDHYDRDEFPVVEFRPTRVPGLLNGISIFRAVRPYLKVINAAIEFWIESERRGSKRVVEIPKGMDATEKEKYASKLMYEVVECDEPGRARVLEFSGRLTSYKELIPFLLKTHDDVSGINEAVSGRAPNVEETASAAKMRQDQAIAALSYLENAIEQYHEDKARMRVAALQRYVPRATVYADCEACGGDGFDMAAMGAGQVFPCPGCGGTGVDRTHPIKKGADFWLASNLAESWRDDLTLDEIRAEVIVGVEPGSSRADYAERRLGMLTTLADRYVPLFLQQGLFDNASALMREHILATDAPNAESFIPTPDQLRQAAQEAAQAAAANQPQQQSITPEELELKQQEMQAKWANEDRKQRLEEGRTAADLELRSQALQVQAQQAQAQLIQATGQVEAARAQAQGQAEARSAVDPIKAAEVGSKAEIERGKLALDEARLELERQKIEYDAQARMEEIARRSEKEEMSDAMAEHEKKVEDMVASAIESLSEKIAGAEKGVGGEESAEAPALGAKILAALDKVERAMLAPKRVIRDESGRVAGVESEKPVSSACAASGS